MTQIAVSGAAVEFGATTVFTDVTFTVARGERWGIVGRNGSGKTTLFNLITGAVEPTRGSLVCAPGLRVSLLEQHRDFGAARTVWEAVAQPFEELALLEASLEEQTRRLAELGERATSEMLARYGRDQERFAREGGYVFAARVDATLEGLGFDPRAARARALESLSGGERGRIGLAAQLVIPADVLLLDEPTNHLDLMTTRWLEDYLRDLSDSVLVISHDRDFLERVADHVLHFEGGSATSYVGNYSAFVTQRAERRLAQQRAFEQQRRLVLKEEDYIRRNIAGQNSAQAKGRRKRLERLPRLTPPPSAEDAMALRLESAERGGNRVAVAERVRLAVGDRELLRNFSAVIGRGEVIGLIGPNGAGKSTLLDAIAGERATDGGEIRLGASVSPAYYRQDLAQVPSDRTLYDVINDLRPTWGRGQILSHLARFGFTDERVERTAATLSGGEQARVALAMITLSRANLLLLDEPTNHLDIESIEALEDALDGYYGTVILVSHDRALLREFVTRVWALEGGEVTDFPGTFSEWETRAVERERVAARAAKANAVARREQQRQGARRAARARHAEESAHRTARRALEQAEADVAALEGQVAELSARLEDPALYATADGARRSTALAAELETARRALDDALERWAEAMTAMEAR